MRKYSIVYFPFLKNLASKSCLSNRSNTDDWWFSNRQARLLIILQIRLRQKRQKDENLIMIFKNFSKFKENTITYLIVKFALKARGYVDRIQVLQTTFANQVLVDEERTKGRLALSWSAEIGFKTKDRYFFVNCNHFLGLIFVKTNKKF